MQEPISHQVYCKKKCIPYLSTNCNKGFTLIELLVVCALIGIMLSLSIPSLRISSFSDPLKSAARKIVGLVAGVREMAVRSQQPYFLYFSRTENRLWYERDGIAEKENLKKKQQLEPQEMKRNELQLPEGITIREVRIAKEEISSVERIPVWITPKGYMRETHILIEDREGKGISLQFFPFIDTVHISDPSTADNE
jgi:prepilin-type N-terminal cleavage/methylation domain-containing protein